MDEEQEKRRLAQHYVESEKNECETYIESFLKDENRSFIGYGELEDLRKEIINIKNEFFSVHKDRGFFTLPECDKNKIIDAIKEFSLKSSLLYSAVKDNGTTEGALQKSKDDVRQSMDNLSKFIPDKKAISGDSK